MERKYKGEMEMGFASILDENDKACALYHIVKRHGAFTLVPLGDLSVMPFGAYIYPERVVKSPDSMKVLHNGDYVEIEACGEGSCAAPRCSKENLSDIELLLGDSFLFALLLFSDDMGVEDDKKTAVLLKDALRCYPSLNEIVRTKLNIIGKNIEEPFSVFDMSQDELARMTKLSPSNVFAYSNNNLLVPKTFAEENFDIDDTFFSISEIVGPYRPTRTFNDYGMWLGDFLEYKLPQDIPKLYEAPPVVSGRGKGKFLHMLKKQKEEEIKEEEKKKDEEEKKEEEDDDDVLSIDKPSDSSKTDLLQRLKFDIAQKFPEFEYTADVEQFPTMSKKQLEDAIHDIQKKLQEERDKLGQHKRKRTVCFFLISINSKSETNSLLVRSLPQHSVQDDARVRVHGHAVRRQDRL